MTVKKLSALPAPVAINPALLQVPQRPSETASDALSRTILQPTVQAALTTLEYNWNFGALSMDTLVHDLAQQCQQANEGDLSRAESMLVSQAHTLDAIFNHLARRAAMNMGEHLNAAETYLRLALKAQSQCRATLETLAAIKNPPVLFAKQANIAHGHQQVNNNYAVNVARGKNKIAQSKLLEHTDDGQRLDPGKASKTISGNPTLETVETQHRPTYAKRKNCRKP
jgi:hypothetical protein